MSAASQPDAAAAFEPLRGQLTGLAYRMLGSRAEAEDVVQEAYLRWHEADRAAVREPRAYLSRTVTRLCLDQLKSARARRDEYVGPWLPEPVLEHAGWSAPGSGEYADDLSVALLLTLERLSPLERAAFLLHDVFDLDFEQVGEALGREAAACRQLAARARSHVRQEKPRFRPSPEEEARVFAAFTAALAQGDIAGLVQTLAQDAVFIADGGGKVAAAGKPLLGPDRIAKFLAGIVRKHLLPVGYEYRMLRVNDLPGLLITHGGRPIQTIAVEVRDGMVAAVYTVRNPDKLRHVQ
ncbi:MAG: sigma-70 family RNA polymerase sigma factor [Nevskia sp.]|nr:sigma-70 family RNA polymerase sigma factor [Nevskia sp.]